MSLKIFILLWYYYLQDNKLMQQLFCFISDDLTHDTVFEDVFCTSSAPEFPSYPAL